MSGPGTEATDPVARAKAKIADPSTPPGDKAALAIALDAKGIKFDIAVNKNPIASAKQFPETGLTQSQQKLKALDEKLGKSVLPPVENINPAEVMARGAAQYQSLGAADEMAGLGGAAVGSDAIPGFGEGSGLASELPKPGDERKGEASGRTVGRGVDAPKMTPDQERNLAFEESRKSYSEADKAAERQNPALYHGSGIASGIPAVMATGGGAAAEPGIMAFLGRLGLSSLVGGGVGATSGALSAEPGQRMEGAKRGGEMGAILGPTAELALGSNRAIGGATWESLRNKPDVRLLEESGGDVGPIAGFKPNEQMKTDIAEAKSRPGGQSGAELAAERAVNPAVKQINERLKLPQEISAAHKAYYESPEGQRTIPAQTLSDFIDSAGERYRGSDGKPLNPAKLRVFEKKARDIMSPELTKEGFSEKIRGKSPGELRGMIGRRELNAEDLDKLRADFTAQSSHGKLDSGVQGAFSSLAHDIRGVIEENYPGLHAINQQAGADVAQKSGIQALGFDPKTTQIRTSEVASEGAMGPALPPSRDISPDFVKMKQAILSADPDAQKALRIFLEQDPEALAAVREAQGHGAYERLKESSRIGAHTNLGISGPHAVMSGLQKGVKPRIASMKNIPGATGPVLGAVTARDVEALRGMLGMENQQ